MNKIRFWKNWDTDTKYPYLFLMALGLLSMLLGVYYYFSGEELAFGWDKMSELQVVPVPVHEFSRMLETFTLTADGYLLTEQYDVAAPVVNTTAASVFLAILGICLAFYTAAISTMKRLAYFAGVLLLMLLLASFNLDLLGIYGTEAGQPVLLLSIGVLASVSYAFQAFYSHIRFTTRVLILGGILLLLSFFVFSEARFPATLTALHLVNYSAIGTLIASLLFMIWIAYENVNALLWINTQAKTPERRFSLWQFMLVSILYLLNLLLLYLRHVGYVKLDLFYINGYVILLLSIISGFWGMRQREQYYGRFMAFKPAGAILYLVFATITVLSIGYAFATANDSLTVVYHDLIVYTHLAFGFMFFVYVMFNFGRLIDQRLQVYKVVYQAKRLPFYTVFTMGAILLAILVMRTQYRAYFYVYAGYYNYLGDLYKATDNTILAERFYQESALYDNNNVKANYSLAGIYREKNQRNNEILRMKESLEKRPDPKLYIRLANLYDEKEYFFEKLYVLQQGAEVFPESGEIYNNLALLYSQTSVNDSTDYYFNLAQKYTSDEDFVRSNRLAFYTRQAMLKQAEELLLESNGGKYKPLRTNLTTLRQLLGQQPANEDGFTPDSLEQVEDFTLFYNSTLSTLSNGDTSKLEPLNKYLNQKGNQLFMEDLLYLKGLIQHYNGRPKEARSVVENLALASSGRSGYYYNALGLWMMEENNYGAAAAYFKLAKDRGYNNAFLAHSYALALAHQPGAAKEALKEVGFTEYEPAIEVAQSLLTVLDQHTQAIVNQAPDKDKVQYLLAYLPQLSLGQVDAIVNSVQEKELRRQALLARIDYLMQQKNWKAANDAVKETANQLPPEGSLRSELNLKQMKLWLYTKNYNTLLGRMEKLYLTPKDKRQLVYFRARIAESKGRTREASEQYTQAVKMLLYDEEVVEKAAAFFAKQAPKGMKAYNILLDGITYNPYSTRLYKAYALESINQGLVSYADQALEELRNLLTESEYSTFILEFEKQRQAAATRADDWQL
ncbi:tetratricopeptide repeat protein [Pontibacter vulgaris]|uniref:tetratricopeptide repeat protein n=1 Tax=Pontibacter vulgaris TaxID=2905679 RepID=UPI001FA72947|nr:hypothetical protein [Pontibacter vulgaris]